MKDYTPYLPGMHLCQTRKRMEKRINENGLHAMKEFLKGRIDMTELERRSANGANSRKRIFDRANVFILFLVQALTGLTCGHTVSLMQGRCTIKKKNRISSSSSAYCQARCRLELSFLKNVFKKLADFLPSKSIQTWK